MINIRKTLFNNDEKVNVNPKSLEELSEKYGIPPMKLKAHKEEVAEIQEAIPVTGTRSFKADMIRKLIRETKPTKTGFINMANIAREVGVSREYVRLVRKEMAMAEGINNIYEKRKRR